MMTREIIERLDKIIELLELRNNIYQGQFELKAGDYVYCTCHKKGQTSAVEVCPIHD